MPKNVSKTPESIPECFNKSYNGQSPVLPTTCDKKSTNNGIKSNFSNSKFDHEVVKDTSFSLLNHRQSSSSKLKANDYFLKENQGSIKCKSASATPILSRLSTSRYDSMGLVSPCKSKRDAEPIDLFPSGSGTRWWEILLPLKKESAAEGFGNCKPHIQLNRDRLRSRELQIDKARNSKENMNYPLSRNLSRPDCKKMKDETNIKTMLQKQGAKT
ncbi:Sulfate-binding protein [Frankliniella fusca]|uniref:Sulfate-binding protein n=1 Tax=Frankliniella fusca TaxID=407009 RepID=A0AAE1HLQ4_9NEOP|nr:Sulfate-binding protein [Frankliniella fusca]